MRSLAARVAVVLSLCLVGCRPEEGPKSLLAEGCLLNSDCVEPLVCVYRRCHQPCTSRRDCPPGSDCQLAEAPWAVCTQSDCAGKACPTGQQCGTDNQCHAECVADGQCLAEQQCVAGLCVNRADVDAGFRPTSCRYDSECPTSPDVFIVCRADATCGPQCRDARDCSSGGACVGGRCSTSVVSDAGSDAGETFCAYSSDCQGDLVCRAGRCVAECLTSRDCAAGETCAGGRCSVAVVVPDGGAGSSCEYHSQCVAPLACIAGRCDVECRETRDCARGLVCQGGACLQPQQGDGGVDAGCTYNSNCPVGQRCAAGACIAECRDARDCAAGLVCVGSTCVTPPVDAGFAVDGGSLCLFNSDCRVGYRCSALGACIPECQTARDCSAGYDCVSQRCVPAGVTGDAGLPTGFGTPCSFQSTCAPFNLVCGPTGLCIYQCIDDRDCATTSGFCCRTNRCVAGNACVVDAGVVDAGVRDAGVDAGCSADWQCLDNDFCNGSERCVASRCVGGVSPCADNNPCTVDLCDNTARVCSYQTQAIDVDMDQHYPLACGGTADDCDDNDALTFPGSLERCDFKDNNCNGAVDEGMWTEEPGARGPISTSGAYLPKGGPPAVHRTDAGEVLVFAAADTTTGALDAWRLSGTDLSVIGGPFAIEGSTTPWSTCTILNPTAVTYQGKRVVRPTIAVNGDELFVSANIESYTRPQATCCAADGGEVLTSRVAGVMVNATSLGAPRPVELGSRNDLVNNTCLKSVSDLHDPIGWYVDRPSAAWSSHLNRWVAVWWGRDIAGTSPLALRFATATTAGVVSAPRLVFDVPGAAPSYYTVFGNTTGAGFNSPRVAVGPNTVLFIWTNDVAQPWASRFLRWVLFDRDLTSVVAGPFDMGAFPMPNGGTTFLNNPKVDAAWWDGATYQLLFNPQVGPGSSAQADYRARLLSVSEQGAVVGSRPLVGMQTANFASTGFSAGVQPSFSVVAQGRGLVAAVPNGAATRFYWGANAADAGMLSTEFTPGAAFDSRSDAVVVPLSDTRVGVIWSDGNLQRTVMRCGP